MASEKVFAFGDGNFETEVLQSNIPVLVDFWASWCAPCKQIAPLVDTLAEDYEGKVKVGKVNVDENPATPAKYGIRGIPTLILFKDGKVVEAHARKNEEYLFKMLDIDSGARFLGEFSFATNRGIQRFTRNILFDEKIGGTVHLALGASYAESGGRNKSVLHWDMICDLRQDGRVLVDGKLFFKEGEFTLSF